MSVYAVCVCMFACVYYYVYVHVWLNTHMEAKGWCRVPFLIPFHLIHRLRVSPLNPDVINLSSLASQLTGDPVPVSQALGSQIPSLPGTGSLESNPGPHANMASTLSIYQALSPDPMLLLYFLQIIKSGWFISLSFPLPLRHLPSCLPFIYSPSNLLPDSHFDSVFQHSVYWQSRKEFGHFQTLDGTPVLLCPLLFLFSLALIWGVRT